MGVTIEFSADSLAILDDIVEGDRRRRLAAERHVNRILAEHDCEHSFRDGQCVDCGFKTPKREAADAQAASRTAARRSAQQQSSRQASTRRTASTSQLQPKSGFVKLASASSIPAGFTRVAAGTYRQAHSVWELRVDDESGEACLVRKREERLTDLRDG